jgi:tetratricopeptide (TPR) repeat protein
MRHRPLPTFALCAALVVQSSSPHALADARAERAHAASLKHKADEEMEQLKYREALEDYTAAYALSHDPALVYNRARVLEALERFPEAASEIERFAREAPPELKARVPKLAELRRELRSHVSTLSIVCAVAGARVLVRKQLVATTPVGHPIELNAGPAQLEVLAEGYDAFEQEIDLPSSANLDVEVKLTAHRERGHLAVSATPEGSLVFVDGKPFGRAPAVGVVPVGVHEVLVSHTGFLDRKLTANVGQDEQRQLDVTLEEKRPLVRAWWLWTSVGVVVAGGVAATIAVLSQKSAGHGDIAPGQVRGP